MKDKIMLLSGGGGFAFQTTSLCQQLEDKYRIIKLIPADEVMNIKKGDFRSFLIPKVTAIYNESVLNSAFMFFKSIIVSYIIIRRVKPKVIICVGSSSALPVFLSGRVLSVRCIFVESITRTQAPSKTARYLHIAKLASRIYVQWPNLAKKGYVYNGTVL